MRPPRFSHVQQRTSVLQGVSLMGIAICLFGVSSVSSYLSAISLLTLAMAFRGLHYAGITVNPQDFAPNHTGAVFGVMNMASAIPGFIGVYVAGYLLQVCAHIQWMHTMNDARRRSTAGRMCSR